MCAKKLDQDRVLPFNEGAAQLAGSNRPSFALMIAATALEDEYPFASRNVARFNFPSVAVLDPWA